MLNAQCTIIYDFIAIASMFIIINSNKYKPAKRTTTLLANASGGLAEWKM